MSLKRGRRATWWGWEYFEVTSEKNESGNEVYHCLVETGKDVSGSPLKCLAPIAYCGSNSAFDSHLSSCHRLWYAACDEQRAAKKSRLSQTSLMAFATPKKSPEAEDVTLRAANDVEIKEMEDDLLSFVVDDIRPSSAIESINPSHFFFPFFF